MAEWLGHLLGSLPGWLFIPAFIVLVIILAIVWFIFGWSSGYGVAEIPWFKKKKAYLGESKKNGKK